MLSLERREAILDYLKEHHAATVTELSRQFSISETSIRRDLDKLERAGFLRKTYGGAILVEGGNSVLSLDARKQTEKEAKSIIARKAAELIRNGDVVFLDSSSTALGMVPHLERFTNLSVITHGLQIAVGLAAYPQLRTYCLGGLVMPNIFSCSGSLTNRTLMGMHADKLFLSPKAVEPERGVFCGNEEEAAVRRAMMERAEESILLCDAKKLGRRAAFHLCGLEEIHTIVCDRVPEPPWQERFAQHGIRVV